MLTCAERRIIAAAEAIALDAPADDDLTFLDGLLCTVGLPRSRVDGDCFERTSGRGSLRVEAGRVWTGTSWKQQIVPYGPLPRLMLAWICTQAVRHRQPEIWIGDSAAGFLRLLGKTPNGGQKTRGAYAALRRQASALAVCRLQFGWSHGRSVTTSNLQPVTRFDAWIGNDEGQRALWAPTLVLSDEFLRRLLDHATPLDLRALKALSSSALAMDCYTWLSSRLHRLRGPTLVPWSALHKQFGTECSGAHARKNLKKELRRALTRALAVYPAAQVDTVCGGLRLLPSRPPVSHRTLISVENPLSHGSYPRDISTPSFATSPPRNTDSGRDISTPQKPIAVTDRERADSGRVVAVDKHRAHDRFACETPARSQQQKTGYGPRLEVSDEYP
ncbi:replication protein RepA [Sinimarinibacterium flocculans]|uniref:RepA protein n=2 Tax=Sinimarinibacterium flocculans TaxID=985250 RepID=A0A318EHE4_9GAMM|nr:RepA protein [Sinimarinibacterium flocculans]